MKRCFLIVLVLSTLGSFAQKPSKPETYAKTITTDDLKKHLYIVASAEMEGRETATPGQRKAAAYIEEQFKKIGLEPGYKGSYQMYFPVYQDTLVHAALEVNGQSFQLDKDFNVNVATNTSATYHISEVVFIGPRASVDSLRNMNLAGKLVMVTGNAPQGRNQGTGIFQVLQNKGIAGLLLVQSNYPRQTTASRKGNQYVNIFRRSVVPQQFSVSENVARAIAGSEFEQAKSNESLIKTFPAEVMLEMNKQSITLQSSNVIGVLPGTDLKDEYLVITAHYDHLGKRDTVIYYGADDDGSGTVGVIEIAEAFARAKAAGRGPRRSIVFMAVSGEEKGLWGSDFYSAHPAFPLEKTTANLNIDMIGRSDASRKTGDSTNYVYVVGDDKLSSELRPISEGVNKKFVKMELDYKYNDPRDPNRIYFRSDHYNFAKKGVPIIFYYDGMLGADYHRPTDTPDKINYQLLAKRAQLIFHTAWEMANRNEMLKRDLPLDASGMTR